MEELREQEDKAVGDTHTPGFREVLAGSVNVSMGQDELLEGATDVINPQEEVLQRTMDVNDVQEEVLQGVVDGDKVQDVVLQKVVDVDNVENIMMQRVVNVNNIQDEVLQKAVDVINMEDMMLQRTVNVNSTQDEILNIDVQVDKDQALERSVDCNKVQDEVLGRSVNVPDYLVSDEVLKRPEDAHRTHDKVQERVGTLNNVEDEVLEGSEDMDKAWDKILVGGVDMNQVQVEFMKVSTDKDKVQDDVLDDRANAGKVWDDDVNGKKVQEPILEGTREKSKVLGDSVQADKAIEKNLENGVDASKVFNQHEQMDTMRCQVKITTRHSLRLCMANHTARDVCVRLLGYGERISGSGLQVLKESVHLSPMKPLMMPEEEDLEETECHCEESGEEDSVVLGAGLEKHEQVDHADEEDGSLAISDTAYSPCASVMPTPVEETQGGVDILFQSPGRLLKDLHADPEMQEELSAERERELAREAIRQSLCSRSNDTRQLRAFLSSTVRLVAVASVLLLLLLILLLVLLESDLEVSFLQDIRETPEFEQFHYEYYCPLRRWLCYKLVFLTELLWGD